VGHLDILMDTEMNLFRNRLLLSYGTEKIDRTKSVKRIMLSYPRQIALCEQVRETIKQALLKSSQLSTKLKTSSIPTTDSILRAVSISNTWIPKNSWKSFVLKYILADLRLTESEEETIDVTLWGTRSAQYPSGVCGGPQTRISRWRSTFFCVHYTSVMVCLIWCYLQEILWKHLLVPHMTVRSMKSGSVWESSISLSTPTLPPTWKNPSIYPPVYHR